MFLKSGRRSPWLVLGVLCGLLASGDAAAGATAAGPAPVRVDAATAPTALLPQPYDPPTEEASVLAPAIGEQPQSPRRIRWYGRASLGAVYRWAFDESMGGAALEGELGAQQPHLLAGVRLRIEAGRMAVRLPYQVVSLGPFVWLPAVRERVHVGFGLDGGALLISRRTMPGRTLWTVLLGGQVRLTVDLVRIGASGAVVADGGLAVQSLIAAPGPLSVAATLGIGYRP